ncbi:MAG: radical SAM protein [Endomicrobia bacterium]|nr:radical SAM protein [Endomicrobiia bacterium]
MGRVLLLVPYSRRLVLRDYFCSSVSKAGYYWQPIDFLVLSGKLKERFEVYVLDLPIERVSYDLALSKAKSFNADVIIFLSGFLSWVEDFEFVKKLKNRNNKIYGIGETFLDDPHSILDKFDFIDGVILDFTHSQVLEFILNPQKFGFILSCEQVKYFSYPVPVYERFKLRRYNYPLSRYSVYVSLLTNYGCPYRCYFCNSGSLGYKLRDVSNILEELVYVNKVLGIKQVFIKDMTFAATREHTLVFLKEIINLKLDIVWHCYTRVELLDEELVWYMKKSGCYLVQLGIEHKDCKLLACYGKKVSLEDVYKTFLLLRKYKILAGGHFLFGLPNERIDAVYKTLDLVFKLRPVYISFNIFTPRKGSVLSNVVLDERYRKLLKKIVRDMYFRYYFSLKYVFERIVSMRSFYEFLSSVYFGFRLVSRLLSKQ